MRIISGTFRGRKLNSLNLASVRPTSDRIKEAIFSIINFDISGSRFLDLFAGTGQMGIEAISRGAKKVFFVDSNNESVSVINKNLSIIKSSDNATVLNSDVVLFLKRTEERFDIAYLDPPYETDNTDKILSLLTTVMNKNGIILYESPINKAFLDKVNGFCIHKRYRYGKISVTVYKRDVLEV